MIYEIFRVLFGRNGRLDHMTIEQVERLNEERQLTVREVERLARIQRLIERAA